MLCKNCNSETRNPKFCSRTCAAVYNNKIAPKRFPEGKCKLCMTPITAKKRYCDSCKTTVLPGILIRNRIEKLPVNKKKKVQAVVNYRRKIKLMAIDYKGGACSKCGYKKYAGALQFHHLNPEEKDLSFGKSCRSFEFIKPELDKCILLCANCHAETHAGVI